MNIDTIWDTFWIIAALKVIIIGEFSIFSWIRYGRDYRLWYFSRESFREYLERTGKKKGW